MTEYYKGFVKQATPENGELIWRKTEKYLENDLKFSSICEINATLDTSRFHISMPLVGEEIYLVDGKPFQLKPEEYLIFNPNQQVRAEGIFEQNVEGFCVLLTTKTIEEVASLYCLPLEKLLDSKYDFPWQNQAFTIKNYGLKENSFGLYLRTLRSNLLSNDPTLLIDWDEFYLGFATEFLKAHQQIGQHLRAIPSIRVTTKQEVYKRISKAYNYVLENFAEPVSLDELEKTALFSKYHIVRLYRQIYGITPYQHILQLRMEKAKDLLGNNYSPEETADELSFSDRRAFGKAFRKLEGISPSEFQRRNGNLQKRRKGIDKNRR